MKRYDTTQQSWIDADSIKRYDTTEQSWVEAEGCYIKFKLNGKQTNNVREASVNDNGLSLSVKFGPYYTDYIHFTADGLNVPAGAVTLNYFCTNAQKADAKIYIYLEGYRNGKSYYMTQYTPNSGSDWTLSFDTPTDYGAICRIDIRFQRIDDEWQENEPLVVTVSNVVVGNKKFKFPIITL